MSVPSSKLLSNLRPIKLGARRKSGTEFVSEGKIDHEAVWRKDDFVCQFCGFRAEKYQRVVPGVWCGDERAGLTACLYCEQCFSLETTGLAGGGMLIWLPEVGQAELNHLCRAIFIARRHEALADRAQTALEALMSRRAEAKKRLGTDDPLLLGTTMLENLNDQDYAQRIKKLEGIRLLPSDRYLVQTQNGLIDQFPAILTYWQSSRGPFAKLLPQDWIDHFLF